MNRWESVAMTIDRIDLSRTTCDYCDVRIEDTVKTQISYKNGELQGFDIRPSLGACVRVLHRGYWYYASTTDFQTIQKIIDDFTGAAQAMPKDGPGKIAPADPVSDRIKRYGEFAATDVPASTKRNLCESYLPLLLENSLVKDHDLIYKDTYKIKAFKSSNGSEYMFDYGEFGLKTSYTIGRGDDLFYDHKVFFSDRIAGLDEHHEELRQHIAESEKFLGAKPIPAGKYRVVMSPITVGVFAHESFGHKSEADFMLGDKAALEEWKIGKKVGSDVLSIVDYGADVGTSGYCPFDDEGVPTRKTYLIKNGVLAGRLHSRATAAEMDEAPTGNARSVSFEFEPIVRMTGTYVEPGEQSFEEMISSVQEGDYVPDMKHGSGLSTFTIAPTRAYWIRDGELREPVLVSVMSGNVFETLGKVEAVSREFKLVSSAIGGCGKMEQRPLAVSFGGGAVLVKDMQLS